MKTTTLALAPALTLLLLAPSAQADTERIQSRTFSTLDWIGSDSEVGIDAALTSFAANEVLSSGLNSLRFDLHGRYVHPNGVGFTAALPFTTISLNNDDSESALGNLSIGGLYVAHVGAAEIV